MRDWRNWLDGLLGAAISSAANGIVVGFVDPTDFNFSTGLHKLEDVIFFSAIVGAALYLKQKPLPGGSERERERVNA